MNIRAKDAKTVFCLARYAERVFAPMVRELAEVRATLHIDCSFDAKQYSRPWHIDLKVHWGLDGMGLHEACVDSTERIDRAAEAFRATVDRALADLAEAKPVAA